MFIGCSYVAVLEEDSHAMQMKTKDGTMEQLLQWARDNRKDVIIF